MTDDESKQSDVLRLALAELREDFARVEGKPFEHFFCPVTLQDKAVPLCMGHIVNEGCPNSYRGRVVQRKDVDNFYGALAESDFVDGLQAKSMNPRDALIDPKMRKKLRPRMFVDGEEWVHYEDRGDCAPNHSRAVLNLGSGRHLNWVVKEPPEKVAALDEGIFELKIGKDIRLAALISLIKSAYLSLFKLLGYSYALSSAGMEIGRFTLGRFFLDHGNAPMRLVRNAAMQFFQQYINSLRPIESFTGKSPLGTIEDRGARACVSSSGRFFGLIVTVRANADYFAVLMPAFNDADAAATYFDFLRNENEVLHVHNCEITAENMQVSRQIREIRWPKNDPSFRFDK